ncbi:hypothetical protein KQI41_01140 [Tissierella pigra]|uniref:hypothetical protein n=1 Tax=Tissierella pigra TaxID=2607614 RepID=UPI001C0FCBE1|nr:hypothetical protein [Tissierella pigra]MBU5425000.1 hypothetical protein [Tissierella pigra]
MNPKIEKYLLILFILMFGLLNLGIAITTTTLLLDFDRLVKEQLIEIIAIILFAVLFNYVLLIVHKDEGRE